MTIVELVSPFGGIVHIIYSWTFGELAITCALCALTVMLAMNFVYKIIFQLWQWRGQ